MSVDDAMDFLIDCLHRPRPTGYATYGYDLYLPNIAVAYRKEIEVSREHEQSLYDSPQTKEMSQAFLDAAWELCRRGILRPSVARFGAQGVGDGNGYSLTSLGRDWIADPERSPMATGRMPQLFGGLSRRLGPGFLQRANEAVQCHTQGTYLACCAMCGAAAEFSSPRYRHCARWRSSGTGALSDFARTTGDDRSYNWPSPQGHLGALSECYAVVVVLAGRCGAWSRIYDIRNRSA